MPRPRFQRLSTQKRARIVEAAAREFAAHGYHDASLNRILQEASISKGAAYYYFDDKADLFATTVAYYANDLMQAVISDLEQLDATSFWPAIQASYEQQLDIYADRPWAFGVLKAGARLSTKEIEAQPTLRQLTTEITDFLQAIVRRGQDVGVIRRDLPDELLMALFIAVDDSLDSWLLDNWETMSLKQRKETVQVVLDGLARFMAPLEEAI